MKRNIILMTMCTLGPQASNRYYLKGQDEPVVTDCDGQLESIVKYALLDKNFQSMPLEIILLATKDTKTLEAERDGRKVTAVSYFEYRVASFCSETDTPVSVHLVDLDENDPNPAIFDTIQYIRSIKTEIGQFWIDTHGGFRDVVLSLEAIVSLLKVDGIIPNKIYSIQFGRNKPSYIVNQDSTFALFDFVSAMNEFINYGSVDMLQQYYKSRSQNDTEKALLEAMKLVSDGSQEGEPKKYVDGLDKLGERIDSIDEQDILLRIFKDYIRSSYGTLLDPKARNSLDIVIRCLSKGLIMQAMAFLETLMPGEFIRHKIIQYDPAELERCRKYMAGNSFLWKDDDNLVFDSFVASSGLFWDLFTKLSGYSYDTLPEKNDQIKAFADEILRNKNSNKLNTRFNVNNGTGVKIDRKNEATKIEINSAVTNPKDLQKAGRVMRLHRVLKECRNSIIHCDPERLDISKVRELLELYISETAELFKMFPVPDAGQVSSAG